MVNIKAFIHFVLNLWSPPLNLSPLPDASPSFISLTLKISFTGMFLFRKCRRLLHGYSVCACVRARVRSPSLRGRVRSVWHSFLLCVNHSVTHFVLLIPFLTSLQSSPSHYAHEFTPTPSPSAVAMETGLCQVAPHALWFTLTSSGWFTRPRDPGSARLGARGRTGPSPFITPTPPPPPPHTV